MLSLSPPSAKPNNPRLLCLLANGVLGCTLRFRPREFPRYCLFIVSNIIRVFFVPPVPFRSFRSIRSFRLSSASVLCPALIRRDIFPPHRSCSRGSARENFTATCLFIVSNIHSSLLRSPLRSLPVTPVHPELPPLFRFWSSARR